jgi:lysophospholipase
MDRRAIPDGLGFADWQAPDGWSLRRFDWAAPSSAPAGSLLFLGGRGDFVEKYLEALAHWHKQGWALAGFDWRGQGGSGRNLADRTICHIPDFDPLLDDLRAFAADWRASSPGPHVIVAHSMGAQIALRLLTEAPARADGAVLLAPMVGIGIRGLPTGALAVLARLGTGLGRGEKPIWAHDPGNRTGWMTACPERQADKLWWKAERPEIASGAPSWGWLAAACASIARLTPGELEKVKLPVLLLASRRDPVIDLGALRRAAPRLPDARLTLFDGKGHELLREADAVRLPVLARIDAFLEEVRSGF